jgi:hypothetical protein
MQYATNKTKLKKHLKKDILIILITIFLGSELALYSFNANASGLRDYTCIFDENNYTLNNVVSNLFVNNLKEKNIKFNSLRQGDFVSFPEINKSKTQDVKKFGQDNHQYFYKFKLCYK